MHTPWACTLPGHSCPPGMHPPGMHPPGHTCPPGMYAAPLRILRDAVNERVVHILLECILVSSKCFGYCQWKLKDQGISLAQRNLLHN